ncbi:MAG: hypothetical protein IPO67_05330 [Deltaproteobacteria bacterium]|nr:hypothetical protein [Deltaproteobacteria bacterium]
MNRVETAIAQGRCLIVVSARLLQEPEVLAELRRRSTIPSMSLGADVVSPAKPLSVEALAPVVSGQGGVLVLVEPDGTTDARALEELSSLVKASGQSPRLVVVARSFNPFSLPMAMRLMKMDHEKARAKDFLSGLPVPAGQAVAAPAPAPAEPPRRGRPIELQQVQAAHAKAVSNLGHANQKKGGPSAPHFNFVGRERELPELVALFKEAGPIAVVGASGVGRRWLIEVALETLKTEGTPLTVLPEVHLQRGVGFDTVVARLAEAAGDDELKALINSREPVAPALIIERLIAALQNESLSDKVIVLRGLDSALGPDDAIWSQDRTGLLLHALLTQVVALRVVFVSTKAPVFYKEGQRLALRVFRVEGLRGRELYSIFEGWHAGDVPRDKMGEVFNQTAGHPLATRLYAVAWRDTEKRDKLLDDKKFLKMNQADNTAPVIEHIQSALRAMPEDMRKALFLVGHSPLSLTGKELGDLGISRDARIRLLNLGLLDSLPGNPDERRFYMHDLVAEAIGRRELSEYELLEQVGPVLSKRLESSAGVEKLALTQELNRMLVSARKVRARLETGYPDNDPVVNSLTGLLRSRQPRPDMALQRANEILKQAHGNTELRALKLEAMAANNAPVDELKTWLAEAERLCPTPELYHAAANAFSQRKDARGEVIETLTRGAAAFPHEARLRRRLGGVLFEAERFEEAEAVLREAMDLEPMAPEAYSRLGEVLVNRGRERWADAEEALRFAMSLEPERGVHRARLGRLLRVRAMVSEDSAAAAALREEAKELLEAAIKESSRYGWPFLELTYLLLDMDGDMDRAEWCLHKAHKIFEGKHPGLSLALARIMARTRREEEAEQRIQRALKGKSNPHEAHFALGELYYSMGKVFAAASEFETAINFAPEGIPERELYKLRAAQTTLLITSGQAVEIEKAAEVERAERALQQAAQAAGEVKHQSDRGNTVVRRKGAGRGGERAGGGEARGGGRGGRGGRGQAAQAAPEGDAAGGEAAGAEAPSDITPDEAGDGVGEELPSSDEIPMDGDPSAE